MNGCLYEIGNFVFFETSPSKPYNVRRIEELIKVRRFPVQCPISNDNTLFLSVSKRQWRRSTGIVSLSQAGHFNPE